MFFRRFARSLAAAAVLGFSLAPGPLTAQALPVPPPCLSTGEVGVAPSPPPRGAPVWDAFARFDEAPVLQNREEVARALEREYPPTNREAGVGGETYLWVLVDAGGVARAGQVNISSGCQELDDAALRAAPAMRFSPAMREGQSIAVWIPIAVSFDPSSPPADDQTPVAESGADLDESPSFTPFDVAPVVRNRSEVAQALQREYPAELRRAGISGRVIVWVRLDAEGNVGDVQINASSGHDELDQAAVRVGRLMRFSPAMNAGQAVPAWISIPMSFRPTSGGVLPLLQ